VADALLADILQVDDAEQLAVARDRERGAAVARDASMAGWRSADFVAPPFALQAVRWRL
jgi:hypothetical protein